MQKHTQQVLLLLVFILSPSLLMAGQANLMLFPTEIIFGNRDKGKTITLVNNGDATGVFEISWFDTKMTAEGPLQQLEEQPAWSLQPHIRFSPRRVVLKPGQNQTVKIVLRRTGNITEGEYFSHLRVLTLNDDVDSLPDEATPNTVTIKARTAIAVPVIWRNSPLQPAASFEQIQFDKNGNLINLNIVRSGNLSTRGTLTVLLESGDSPSIVVSEPIHAIIYPNIKSRFIAIPLTTSLEELDPRSRITIRYTHGEGDNQQLVGEMTMAVKDFFN